MSEYFIQKINIKNVRDIIKDYEIPLSDNTRKHLLITGKNGSGKTSLLEEIDRLLQKLLDNKAATIVNAKNSIIHYNNGKNSYEKPLQELKAKTLTLESQRNDTNTKQIDDIISIYNKEILEKQSSVDNLNALILHFQKQIDDFPKVELIFSNPFETYTHIANGDFILAFFGAKRENNPIVPEAITNVNIDKKNSTKTNELHNKFISYMVRLRNKFLDAKEDGDYDEVEIIKKWFENFEKALKELFEQDNLKLKYYREELNFKIVYENKEFGLNQLSDGYSSLIAIVTELILRMEAYNTKSYDLQGVVLIDEIETHLHVELQKKVLPFLVSFFPKIQFIVTTHSPFVLQSVDSAIICDLERREVIDSERLQNASYSKIVKEYFEVDSEFATILVNKIQKYEDMTTLFEQGNLDENRQQELVDLDFELDKLSPMLSDEIYLRYKEAQKKIQND